MKSKAMAATFLAESLRTTGMISPILPVFTKAMALLIDSSCCASKIVASTKLSEFSSSLLELLSMSGIMGAFRL